MSTAAPAALRKTALNATHRRLGAKMVDFGGWDMPVEYSGLIAEHMAVRTARRRLRRQPHGRHPVSRARLARRRPAHLHERRLEAQPMARRSTRRCFTRNGTFVDDIIVHKFSDNDYLLVINAGTREKDCQLGAQEPSAGCTACTSPTTPTTTRSSPSRVRRPCDVMRKLTDTRSRRHQELLVHLGHGLRPAQHADRPHRLHRRRRLRDLHPLRRAHQRARLE